MQSNRIDANRPVGTFTDNPQENLTGTSAANAPQDRESAPATDMHLSQLMSRPASSVRSDLNSTDPNATADKAILQNKQAAEAKLKLLEAETIADIMVTAARNRKQMMGH